METKEILETPVVDDNEDYSEFLDQPPEEFDNLNEAVDAIADDENEAVEEQPTDDQADEPEAEEVDGEEAEAAEESDDSQDVRVTLPDGEEVTMAELTSGYMKDRDYRHKTDETARKSEALDQRIQQYSERMTFAETALQNVAKFVQGLIPPEPPLELASTNAAEYTKQKALRTAAIQELQQLKTAQTNVDEHKSQVSAQDMAFIQQEAEKELVKRLPHLKDPAAQAAFYKSVGETAESFGFTAQEIETTHDPRVLELVHYAKIGKRSEQNRKNAQRRVQTPAKAKNPPRKAAPSRNADAMKRLSQSGSFKDAMNVDFD